MEGLASESAGVWLAGKSGLGLQEHRLVYRSIGAPQKLTANLVLKMTCRPKHADRQRLPEGLAAIFLSFSGDTRHISAGFLICLRDPGCRSKILDITKHSV